MANIRENLMNVEQEIQRACDRSGRKRNEVSLIAVSKTKPISMLQEAYAEGIRDFGENRVQELMEKIPLMPSDVRWHMIGHLQRNKVKYIIDKVSLIHSVDSFALAEEISREAVKKHVTANILIEVNVAEESSKFGVTVENAPELVAKIAELPAIQVKGFMTVAPFTEHQEENRIYFHKLMQLAVDIDSKNIDNNNNAFLLSMGMTGDYSVAIEEGAAYIRVGTGIFGERGSVIE